MINDQMMEIWWEYIEQDGLKQTLKNLYQMQWSFENPCEVESEIQEAMKFLGFLNSTWKEMGLHRNNLKEGKRKESTKEHQSHLWASVDSENNNFISKFPTEKFMQKWIKLQYEKSEEDIKKLVSDFDIMMKFIENMSWEIRRYLDMLNDRLQYYRAIDLIERKNN
jgi:hypothetical protein